MNTIIIPVSTTIIGANSGSLVNTCHFIRTSIINYGILKVLICFMPTLICLGVASFCAIYDLVKDSIKYYDLGVQFLVNTIYSSIWLIISCYIFLS